MTTRKNTKADMVKTLIALREELDKLAALQIGEASKKIDSYLKLVEREQRRRGK